MSQEKKVGLVHLTCIGLTSIIGSGWLFASMYAARTAGTGAFVTWVVGALLMMFVALCLSELISLYPQRGLLASICSYSHNRDFAFIIAIANWFGTLCVIPSEAIATTRYLDWSEWTVIPLILMYALLNNWGVTLFTRFNTALALFKMVVPIVTVVALLLHGVDTSHFHSQDLFVIEPILAALISGGIIYGFNGCQMIVNFTSEAKNPQRNIPLALFMSLAISVILYLALQITYIGIADSMVDYNDPFIQVAVSLGFGWLVILLKVDATLSPSGTGFAYISGCTRMLTAMSREGQMPKQLGVKNEQYNMSRSSLLLNVIISIALFMVFRTWQALVIVVSTFHIVSYLAAPLAVGRLRLCLPDSKRNFTVPLHQLLCPCLFFTISYFFTVAGVKSDISITSICLLFLGGYIVMNYRTVDEILSAITRAFFVPLWLITFTLCSWFQLNVFCILIFSLVLYYVGVYFPRWRNRKRS